MMIFRRSFLGNLVCAISAWAVAAQVHADVPLGGFIPFVGIGLTDEFETFDSDPTGLYNIADPSFTWGGSPLGPGSSAYFDIALLDTGAATHILTPTAAGASSFAIQAEGLRGTNFQQIFGAVGPVDLRINDPLGVYAAGLGDRTGAGTALVMNTAALRGQTSVATLEAPVSWTLPNILGLPMAAQHGIAIRNDEPLIFQHQGRTMRTPQIDFIDLGTGGQQGISRRTNLRLRPSASFLTGPAYLPNLELGGGFELNFHDNPLSPTVVENGGLYVEVDLKHGADFFAQNVEFLFDTGADLTVVSEVMAASLGFDVVLDQPDFFLEVEGGGGVTSGVPGFYLDELKIDAVGGSLVFQNVPMAVLDVPNPNDPANVIDAILGMHVFTGRNLVIDAVPAATGGGNSPSLYIGDPVTETHTWASVADSGSWSTPGNWSAPGTPSIMWDAQVRNVSGAAQTAFVGNATVNRLTVAGGPGSATMTATVSIDSTLTTFGEVLIETGGRLHLESTGLQHGRLDAQFVNVDGGVLSGDGEIFVGTGPVNGAVRNLSGRVAPSTGAPNVLGTGRLQITGDFANLEESTLAIDLGGTTAVATYDQLSVSRFAFLGGTLEVSLANPGTPFVPNIGDMFTIITAGQGVVGEFDNLILPAGFQWNVDYQPNAVVLQVAALASIAGDFDGNGIVNAADLTAWRAGFGPTYSGADFLTWQRNLGASLPPVGAVPEPRAAALLAVALGGVLLRRRAGGLVGARLMARDC